MPAPTQHYLPGLEPRFRDRLFFALLPDAAAAARIAHLAANLRADHKLSGLPLSADRFHISLYHLGDYDGLPRGVVAEAAHAAEAVRAAPFEVAFDAAGSFARGPRKRPLVLRAQRGKLEGFHRLLGAALRATRLRRWARKAFTPHLTLLYDQRHVGAQAVEPVGWSVGDFVLVHSLIGQTTHIHLARWPLRG